MGYTNYYSTNNLSKENWETLVDRVKYLLNNLPTGIENSAGGDLFDGHVLTGCHSRKNPTVNKSLILFNGGLECTAEGYTVKREKDGEGYWISVVYKPDGTRLLDSESVDFKEFDEHNIEDLSHETFVLKRTCKEFCKTARKPYDVIVKAVLLLGVSLFPENFKVSSDGDYDDWHGAEKLLQDVFGMGKLTYSMPNEKYPDHLDTGFISQRDK